MTVLVGNDGSGQELGTEKRESDMHDNPSEQSCKTRYLREKEERENKNKNVCHRDRQRKGIRESRREIVDMAGNVH